MEPRVSLCQEIFLTSYRSIQIFYFLCCLALIYCVFLEIVHFISVIQFVGVQLLILLLNNPFCFYRIGSNIPTFISNFSNLNFFLFFHLAKSLPSMLIFSNNQISVLLVVSNIIPFSILFISPLISYLLSSALFGFSLLCSFQFL